MAALGGGLEKLNPNQLGPATQAPIRAALTPEELEAQEKREIFIQDQRGLREKAEMAMEKGLKEGMEKGRVEGRAEGERETARRIARSLLPALADDAIAASTGLSLAEVQALRAGQGCERAPNS